MANARLSRKNTTGFKGVIFDRARRKFRAEIKKDGKTVFLGRFDKDTEASAAYMEAALKLFGDFAYEG
jgi:hypothetical protein